MPKEADEPGSRDEPTPLHVGTRITIRRHKWPHRDHYTNTATVLGEGSWGLWAGMRGAEWWFRDGAPIQMARTDLVELLPRKRELGRRVVRGSTELQQG